MVFTHNPGSLGWFVLHPLLQTLSLGLFTYGIVTLQPTSHADPKGKQAGLDRHQYTMFLLAFPVILVGTWAVWHNKELKNAEHYQTWHATFGGLCLMWMIGQIILGAGSVWFNGKLFGGGMKAKALWKYHRLSGYLLFPMLLFTVHLGGAWSNWATKNSVWAIRLLAFTVAPILVVGGLYARTRSVRSQTHRPSSHENTHRSSKMRFW
ncbi:hypothetical protein BKA70DRAFT_1088725 [Coprinopsis sp. MPI-PUGE-AT-0042]|nr:hypothetical protein BKA70DRAFT_1088725 [Coprinopsis sp. MPI-PUGE-AT-0042]